MFSKLLCCHRRKILGGVKLRVKCLNFEHESREDGGGEDTYTAELELRGFHALPAPEIYITEYAKGVLKSYR